MIIITGASKGLGRSICERLLQKKIDVIGLSRNVESLYFPAISCDIRSYSQVKEVSQHLKNEKIRVTGLINAAGIASMNLALTTPARISENIMKTNLLGTIYCCQLFTPLMIRNKQGFVINFSTIAVSLGIKGESVYAASKAGVESFTRSFAREIADFNIRVNCIAPGPINTDLLNGLRSDQINEVIRQQIIAKQFQPSDISDLVEVLIDSRSSSLSGQVLYVGGV